MPKLLLINPINTHKGLGNLRTTAWPPLNLPYIAAVTPINYEIEMLDENVEPFSFREADIVGITSYTSSVSRAYEIANIYRSKGVATIMGGIHVSMVPEEAVNYCDSVVIGEAEDVWPQVIRDFENNCLKRQYKGTWSDLKNLPEPRRDILNDKHYEWGSLQTSRGCPMNCIYCSVSAFNGRRYRRRSIDSVLRELQHITQKKILITDDNIMGYGKEEREWAVEFFSKVLEKKLKKVFFAQAPLSLGQEVKLIRIAAKAGLKILFVGMESINPETLKAYNKRINYDLIMLRKYKTMISRIRREGIVVIGAFVLGSDNDDLRIFNATLKFIKSSHIDVLQLTKLTPLPGTALWYRLKEEGRIANLNFPKAWDDYRLTKMVFKPEKISISDVYAGCTYIRKEFYEPKETIKRALNTLFTTKSLVAMIMQHKLNASYKKAFLNSDHYKMYNKLNLLKIFRAET